MGLIFAGVFFFFFKPNSTYQNLKFPVYKISIPEVLENTCFTVLGKLLKQTYPRPFPTTPQRSFFLIIYAPAYNCSHFLKKNI